MKKYNIHLTLLVVCTLLISACSHRVLDFTLISSKNIDMTKSSTFIKGKSRVQGEDLVHWIICFPTGTVNIKEAVDRAIESTPGCVALLDGVIYTHFWWFPYIYGQESATIEGTPLIDPSLVMDTKEIPSYGKIELNKNGEVKKIEEIASDEYYALKNKFAKETQAKKFEHSKTVK